MASRALIWVYQLRRLVFVCALALVSGLLGPVGLVQATPDDDVPRVTAGAGPVDRPAPASARPDKPLPPEKVPPPVPDGVRADGQPSQLSAEQWAEARESAADDDQVFTNVLLRPGFVLDDTSLVGYFDVREQDQDWSSWKVRLYDVESKTEQASVTLQRGELEARCGAVREFCRSFGVADDGWVLDPDKKYYITVAAIYDDGREVVSKDSSEAQPRKTVDPPPIPARQAAGCGCGTALSMTHARQAARGDGVNTATGAYTRIESDLSMASFGVAFASTRVYSSANPTSGPFGPGWAWSYGMRVTESEEGVLLRAEDGAEVLFRLQDGDYVRPAGVRSTLRKTETGWILTTIRQVTYHFDDAGRLTAIRDPRGIGVTLAYTDTGITITDPSGREVQVRISDGLIRDILLPDQRKVQYEYDEQGLLTVYKDARARQWRYGYSSAGLLTEVEDPQPNRTVLLRNEYNEAGRVVRQLDALGNTTRFGWDADKQVAKTIDADDVVVFDGYRSNVLVYSVRGVGDTDNHRYDGSLNRNLVVDGNHNQHEAQFDANGNPTARHAPQPLGFNEKTKYDERNNPIEFTDGNGEVWKNTYNDFNELIESKDAEGNTITYRYDERGLMVARTDQRGKVTRFEYIPEGKSNSGLLEAVISPEGRRSEVRYDATGRRIATIDPRGTVADADPGDFMTRYTFDEQDRVLTVLEPDKEHPWRTEYDEVGRTISSVSPTSMEVRYTYLDNGRLTSVTDPRRTVSYTYTNAGRRASVRLEMAGQGPDIVTTYRYNVKGLLHQVTSPRGNVPGADPADFTMTYRYDANDNLVRISRPDPNGGISHKDIKVDELDRTTATTDEFAKTSTFTRDNTGDVTSTKDTLGRTVSMGYDRNGRQTSIKNADGNTSRFEYDNAGNKIREESAVGGVTTWRYTDDGLLDSVTEPRGNVSGADPERFTTHFEYDRVGNRTKVIDPLDHTTVTKYDVNNRVVSVTDANDHATHYQYREDNQVEAVHAPDAPFHPSAPHNNATVYNYYEDGLLASVRDPNLHVTRLEYDRAGRLVTKVDPLNRRVELGYDAENNLVSALTRGENEKLTDTERTARTIVDSYDIAGRRTTRKLGTEGPVYRWGYDAKDRIVSYEDPLGVREVKYNDEDEIERVDRKEAGRTETFSYGYDARGNITSRTYPDGTKVTANYDADSRMSDLTVAGGAAGADSAVWTFGYDIAGNRTRTTLPAATGLTERREYDDAGRLTNIGTVRTGGEAPPGAQDPISDFDLTLDKVGNPTRVVTTRGGVSESVAYGYDATDRVTSACYAATSCTSDSPAAGRIDYTYDLVGNRTSQTRTGTAGDSTTTYLYDAADQLTRQIESSGGRDTAVSEYEYDLNGNQVRAGNDTFSYHLDNSLARATVDGQTATYRYDATGLRLSATTGQGETAATQRWSWDVNGTLPQIALDTVSDAAGRTVEKRGFAYGPDDEPMALLDPATGVYSYTHDWLGGIANMLSPAGLPVAGYDYDPFGNPRVGETLQSQQNSGAGPKNPLQYTGAYQDSTTGNGNYFLRARNYNPGTGRFSSTDPMPQGGSAISAYAYAGNNPMAYTDPTGMTLDPGETVAPASETGGQTDGPSPEDMAKAQQIQSKSLLDVVLEAGGQIIMEFFGINDVIKCLQGDIGACVMTVVGALPWGKIFKAKKIAEAIFRAGKAVVTFFQELKWARAIIQGVAKAAEAAKLAKAQAAAAAARKAARARELAEQAARKVAAEAAARAKAVVAKAKAATKKKRVKDDGCHSFVSGTRVLLADGSSKPINKIKPGDAVNATDPATSKTENRQVTHAIRTDHDKDFVDLTIRDKSGKHTITATDNHPFWSVTRKQWVDAGKLKPGELLRTAAGTYVQVSAVKRHTRAQITYDLTVDAIHTYYVVAGTAAVLVHNTTEPELCGIHGGDSGSPGGPGLVEGPAPLKAYDMLNRVNNRPNGIGKVPGYEGNQGWGNNQGQLPGGKYREWDVNATVDLPKCAVCGRPIRGPERIVTPKSEGGGSYYTPDHYGTFFYVGKAL